MTDKSMKSKFDDKRKTCELDNHSPQNFSKTEPGYEYKKEVAKQKELGRFKKLEFHKEFNKYDKTIKSHQLKDKQLDANPSNLTPLVVSSLLKFLVSIKSDASTLLLLSLFSGRNLKANPHFICFRKSTIPHIEFEVHRKDYDIGDEIKDKFESTSNKLILNLPIWFTEVNNFNPTIDSYKHKVTNLLKEFNQNQRNKITINSIANYLVFWLTNEGYDSADIAIINGESINKSSAVHYYQTTKNKLQLKFDYYLHHLEGLQKNTYQTVINFSNTCIGSQLVIDDQYLSEVFYKFRKKIMNFNFGDFETIQEHHNLITLYTIFLLNLSTGHRPVNDPYSKLSSFNMILKTVFICDKSIDNTLTSRIAILTKTGFLQLNSYLSYLKVYYDKFRFLSIDTTKKIQNMLDGQSSIFKFFKNGELKTVSSKLLKSETKKIIAVPSNWHRHFMRSHLANNNVKGELIDMYMGHEGSGGYGLSLNSNRSLDDLNDVASVIDEIFNQLNIQPTEKYK